MMGRMRAHPVRLVVEPSAERERIHVLIRLLLLTALGMVGCSSLYSLLYLVVPAVAALLIGQEGGATYLERSAPPIVRALRWLAAAYAYLWLLTDAAPTTGTASAVQLEVEPGGTPTPTSALLRLLFSLPALLLLALLSTVAAILWVLGAIAILWRRRLPGWLAEIIALTLQVQFRLVAYHLSLVERYPSLAEAPVEHVSGAA
jgi:hypothetical protein